jgi:hypothetical protein
MAGMVILAKPRIRGKSFFFFFQKSKRKYIGKIYIYIYIKNRKKKRKRERVGFVKQHEQIHVARDTWLYQQ